MPSFLHGLFLWGGWMGVWGSVFVRSGRVFNIWGISVFYFLCAEFPSVCKVPYKLRWTWIWPNLILSSRHWRWCSGAADQVGSDAQVFPDGVLVLGWHRGLAEPRPLAVDLPDGVVGHLGEDGLGCVVFLQGWTRGGPSRLKAAGTRVTGAASDKRCITQELPHDGVGLLEGLGSMGGVEEQPVNDIDLLRVVLLDQRQRQRTSHSLRSSVGKC